MSLIGEALRKARAEAARREVERDGVPIPAAIVGATRRPRGALSPVAVTAIALATALAGAALAWMLARGDRTSAPPARMAAETPPAGVTRIAAPASGIEPTPVPPSAYPTRPERTAPPEATPSVQRSEQSAPDETAGAGPVHQTVPPRSEDPPGAGQAEHRRRSDSGGERSFVLRAELGYATLELDYLVYRPGSPFGRVNGQDIVVGSTVAGFTVEEIGRDFVRLRDERGPLVLKVR